MKKALSLCLCLVLALSLCACIQVEKTDTGYSLSFPFLEEKVDDAVEQFEEDLYAGLTTEATANSVSFTVTVVHADGSEKEFSYETDEEYVGPVLVEAGLIKGNDGPYGLEITEVDGETAIYATDGAYWAIYEGDKYATTGIDKVNVTAGGSYTLKYERG